MAHADDRPVDSTIELAAASVSLRRTPAVSWIIDVVGREAKVLRYGDFPAEKQIAMAADSAFAADEIAAFLEGSEDLIVPELT